jgi:uncharacterized protein YeaO (DUF488 family)
VRRPLPRNDGASGGASIAGVYHEVDLDLAHLVLVERLWPREWPKGRLRAALGPEVASSLALRTWYGHVPRRFASFARKYRVELDTQPASAALEALRQQAQRGDLVLVTATKDLERSGAAVLRDVLVEG